MEVGPVTAGGEDVHELVVVPTVATFLAGGTQVVFGLLFGGGVGVEVGRGEEDFVRIGAEEGAGGLAGPG
jgi:hypothetical protein